MTFSNRISIAGAIPLIVALGIVAMLAAIFLAPAKPVSAIANAGTCDLSPVHLDMLLDRYGLKSYQCNTLNYSTTAPTPLRDTGDNRPTAAVWDYSGKGLESFEISDADAKILKRLKSLDTWDTTATPPETFEDIVITDVDIAPDAVRYIDLTGNPLSVEDVSFANIPPRIAVILSADSNVSGFQQEDYTVTEESPGFISLAFPDLRATDVDDTTTADVDESLMTAVVTVGGDATSDRNSALGTGDKIELVTFGIDVDATPSTLTLTALARRFQINSEADNVIFYFPITVAKDNDNDDDWDIRLTIAETDAGLLNANDDFELTNNEADVTILDADAPSTSVCDRSEDVEEALLRYASDSARGGQAAEAGFGGHVRCDDITLRDLSTVGILTVADADTDDEEPIANLVAGDFEGLTKLTSLRIVGARSLPSGIFAGVGSKVAGDGTVLISFEKNTPGEDGIDKVGDFTPSTIPTHIWDDQEKKQVIVLDDDTNDKDEGVTKGLDADLYAGTENGHFFVLTNAATSAYVLADKVVITAAALEGADATNELMRPTIDLDSHLADADRTAGNQRGGGPGSKTSKVVRFAITIPDVDDKDKGERNTWLFLFAADNDTSSADSDQLPTDAGDLKDVATVVVTDDD